MSFKDLKDLFIKIFIILLFIIILIINVIEIGKFISSRYKLLSLSSKENNPSFDSLNAQYCNYTSMFSEKDTVDYNNYIFVIIYGILLLLFWYNTIINIFSLPLSSNFNEIKIVYYKNYFNYDIYKKYNYEYSFINGLRIFILIAFVIHSYILYKEFMGTNEEDMKIHNNVIIIDDVIMKNIDCDLISIHDPSKGKYITRDTLGTYLENISALRTNADVDKYVKICMTAIIINKNSNNAKKTIKDVQNICKNPICIYSRLENNMEDIFPENIDKYIHIIRSAIKTKGYAELTSSQISELSIKYKEIRKKLVDSFNIIKSYKPSRVIYYKFILITSVLAGIFFATSGIAYFLIYDVINKNKILSQLLFNSPLPLPFDYFINKYFNRVLVYIVTIISMYIAFVINF